MYKCKICGNTKLFAEHNAIKTYLVIDDETGEILHTDDKFLGCSEVICGCCGASSEDESILDRHTNKQIIVG